MPVVAGPILFLLWLDNGAEFAQGAAGYSLLAITPLIAFSLTYAWLSRHWRWPATIASAYCVWLIVAIIVLALPAMNASWCLAAVSLFSAPFLFPKAVFIPAATPLPKLDLALRMTAGAALTFVVTSLAAAAGTSLSGLLALFPVISGVLVVFIHRGGGSNAVGAMLKGFVRGLYSLAAFCIALRLVPADSTATAFVVAIAATLIVQGIAAALTRRSQPANVLFNES
jgi:uncharacterized membrane protein (GlpM family)